MSKRKECRYLRKMIVHIPGMIAFLFLFIVLGLISRVKAGGPWYVSPTGSDNNDCLSWETACQAIESAVSKADSGDTVFLATGVFTRGATINKNLILQGAGADNTIVNVNASGRVFTITSGCVVTMTGMAISGGNAAEGGGIYSEGTLALSACTVYSNTATGSDGAPGQTGGSGAGGGIYNSGTLTLSDCDVYSNSVVGGNGALWLRGGSGIGGGIYSTGTLTLSNCNIHNNSAIGGDGGNGDFHYEVGSGGNGLGGGIYSIGSLTLNSCVVRDNMAVGGNSGINEDTGEYGGSGGDANGGGIYTRGALSSRDSILKSNAATGGIGASAKESDGGGIYGGGTLIVGNTSIISNTAYNGAGMRTDLLPGGGTKVEITNSVLSYNVATGFGGGIRDSCANMSDCTLILTNSTISGNKAKTGGGIVTSGASGATSVVSITGSTISGNTASFLGGGIYNANQIDGNKTLVLVNSTVSGNDGGDAGGGIRLYTSSQSTNSVEVINTSIVSNTADSGCGIYANAGGSGLSLVTLENSIVANNSPNQNCSAGWGGQIVSLGHNVDSGDSCGFAATGDITGTNPHLGPLQDNGGPTYTHALLPGSPATDAGNPTTCMSTPVNGVDQRGFPRGVMCDIGAYEIPEYTAFLPVLLQGWPESRLEVAIVMNDTR